MSDIQNYIEILFINAIIYLYFKNCKKNNNEGFVMSTKPNFGDNKSLIKQALNIDSTLNASIHSQSKELAAVRQAADAFYSYKFKAELEGLDIDILTQGKQGIRISYLRNVGINNIYQLSKMSYYQIEAISGIGAQGAQKIHETTKQIVENTRQKLSLRINADTPTKTDDALLSALYVLVIHDSLRAEMKALFNDSHKTIVKLTDEAKAATSGIRWFFASKKSKENTNSAVSALESFIGERFGEGSVYDKYTSADAADITERRAHFRENSVLYYSALEKYCKHINTASTPQTGLSAELIKEIEAHPIDLKYMKATLRSYQTFGVKYAVHQKRTLLGDEMGLGKTIQAIAAMAALKADGKHHFMVVCPASVLINWCREIEKHSSLAVTKVHGADEEALYNWRANGDVAVTTFESISRFALPERFTFDMLVVDEAHYVKNPEALRTKAMQPLLQKSESVLYMSGTPLVNRVDEMCFLVKCLQPAVYEKLEKVKSISTAEQFRQEIAPVYLRRTRDEVLKELPELTEKEQWCVLGDAEKAIYRDAVVSGNLMAIRQVSWQVARLEDSSKAMRLKEIWESAAEQGRKLIVFSFFRNTLEKVRSLLGDACLETISGDISPARRQEIVDEFNKANPGAVLVSQVQAGGTGLNIQAASVVVFCEPQLTPAIENQAISRAYRMGQTRDVIVHRLLADDTIDERMLEILSGKQKEFDSFADESVIGDTQLDAQQAEEGSWITKMVKEEQERLLSQQ